MDYLLTGKTPEKKSFDIESTYQSGYQPNTETSKHSVKQYLWTSPELYKYRKKDCLKLSFFFGIMMMCLLWILYFRSLHMQQIASGQDPNSSTQSVGRPQSTMFWSSRNKIYSNMVLFVDPHRIEKSHMDCLKQYVSINKGTVLLSPNPSNNTNSKNILAESLPKIYYNNAKDILLVFMQTSSQYIVQTDPSSLRQFQKTMITLNAVHNFDPDQYSVNEFNKNEKETNLTKYFEESNGVMSLYLNYGSYYDSFDVLGIGTMCE